MKKLIHKVCSEQARTNLAMMVGVMSGVGLLFESGLHLFRDSTHIDPFHDHITGALFLLTAVLLIGNEFVLQKRTSRPWIVWPLLFAATAAGLVIAAFTAVASWALLPAIRIRMFASGFEYFFVSSMIAAISFSFINFTPAAAVYLLARQVNALYRCLPEAGEGHGRSQAIYAITIALSTAAWMLHLWTASHPHPFHL